MDQSQRCVELLQTGDADVDIANNDGKTPAMVARDKGHALIASLLEAFKSKS